MIGPEFIPPKQWITTHEPLTKRERFAMAAMQGFCASPDVQDPSLQGVAKASVLQADALIAALKSIPEPE